MLLALGGLAAASPADQAALARSYGGRIWTVDSLYSIPEDEGPELARWLDSHPEAAEVTHKGRDSPWTVQLLAVLAQPAGRARLKLRVLEGDALRLELAQPAHARAIVVRARVLCDPRRGFHAARYRLEIAAPSGVVARGGFSLVD